LNQLIITRHGESQTNIDKDIEARARGEKVVLNVRNNVLTPTGVRQAQKFGVDLLADTELNVRNIVCSPYARTKQTAYTICGYLPGLPMIHYERSIREIDWKIAGKFHRLEDSIPGFDTKKLPIDQKPLINKRARLYSLESQREVYARVTAGVARLCERYLEEGDLLIVTHFYPCKALQAWLEHGKAEAMADYDARNLCELRYTAEQVAEAVRRSR
jgi:broad specificity phosphatase PhoE